ncbi:MAG TPA: SMP-30/gluconolactonase/LRE family protein [Patescibacteria group bacterium]|nr:SMP-30/gluconolactonase/LRE family protein [Patescibacteria group bacterium]
MRKILSLFLVFCLVTVFIVRSSVPVFAAYQYDSKFASSGSAVGFLNIPLGMTIDSSGNIYVADEHNQRIEEFNSIGLYHQQWKLLEMWGDSFSQVLPVDVKLGSDGKIYVSAYMFLSAGGYFGEIFRFDQDGSNLEGVASNFNAYGGIAFDSHGNIYAADVEEQKVYEFSATDFSEVREWGSYGSGDGQFINGPTALALDGADNVYVVDNGNNRIQKFAYDGTFIKKWGGSGSGDGQFNSPNYIAMDSFGHIYVTDSGNQRVEEFDSDGGFIAQIGSGGSGDGQFQNPQGIAFDSANNLFVSDVTKNNVQKFTNPTPSPTPTPTLTPTPTPSQPTCSPSSSSVVLSGGSVDATITASGGDGTYTWLAGGSDSVNTSGSGNSIATVTYSSTGEYYVFATSNGIQSTGCVVDVVNPTPTSSPGSNSNSSVSLPPNQGITPTCSTTPNGSPNLFQINTKKDSATIYFSPVGNTQNYQISYGFDSSANQFNVMTNQGSSTGVLSFTVGSLPSNATIYFKVFAQNNCSQGAWSNTMQAKTNGGVYYKNIISQILSLLPKQTTVLGAKTSKVLGAKTRCENYTVQAGDSLWGIASLKLGNGAKYKSIMQENNLSSNKLNVGQTLKVGC